MKRLYVIGMGPGSMDQMTPQAKRHWKKVRFYVVIPPI